MAHLVVEYSANVEPALDVRALVATLADAAGASGVLPPVGLRVRAYRAETFQVGDGTRDAAFVHVAVRVGPGRERPVLEAEADRLFRALQAATSEASAALPLTLSLELAELSSIRFNDNALRRVVDTTPDQPS